MPRTLGSSVWVYIMKARLRYNINNPYLLYWRQIRDGAIARIHILILYSINVGLFEIKHIIMQAWQLMAVQLVILVGVQSKAGAIIYHMPISRLNSKLFINYHCAFTRGGQLQLMHYPRRCCDSHGLSITPCRRGISPTRWRVRRKVYKVYTIPCGSGFLIVVPILIY